MSFKLLLLQASTMAQRIKQSLKHSVTTYTLTTQNGKQHCSTKGSCKRKCMPCNTADF